MWIFSSILFEQFFRANENNRASFVGVLDETDFYKQWETQQVANQEFFIWFHK